jgi:hypothetical protein
MCSAGADAGHVEEVMEDGVSFVGVDVVRCDTTDEPAPGVVELDW